MWPRVGGVVARLLQRPQHERRPGRPADPARVCVALDRLCGPHDGPAGLARRQVLRQRRRRHVQRLELRVEHLHGVRPRAARARGTARAPWPAGSGRRPPRCWRSSAPRRARARAARRCAARRARAPRRCRARARPGSASARRGPGAARAAPSPAGRASAAPPAARPAAPPARRAPAPPPRTRGGATRRSARGRSAGAPPRCRRPRRPARPSRCRAAGRARGCTDRTTARAAASARPGPAGTRRRRAAAPRGRAGSPAARWPRRRRCAPARASRRRPLDGQRVVVVLRRAGVDREREPVAQVAARARRRERVGRQLLDLRQDVVRERPARAALRGEGRELDLDVLRRAEPLDHARPVRARRRLHEHQLARLAVDRAAPAERQRQPRREVRLADQEPPAPHHLARDDLGPFGRGLLPGGRAGARSRGPGPGRDGRAGRARRAALFGRRLRRAGSGAS